MLRVWIGGWRHVEHLDPTKAHTGILGMSQDIYVDFMIGKNIPLI